MSAEQDRIRTLAERIASRLEGEGGRDDGARGAGGETSGDDEVARLRESLSELQQRLARIESRAGRGEQRGQGSGGGSDAGARQNFSPRSEPQGTTQPPRWTSSMYVSAAHPSQERFDVGEAVAELVDFFEGEKTCNVEPGNKPCDHCAMCSSRGF